MEFQYILFLLAAFVITESAAQQRICYVSECESSNSQEHCNEFQNVTSLAVETCISPYPDHVPICVKSVHTKKTDDGVTEDVAVFRRCSYTTGQPTDGYEIEFIGSNLQVTRYECTADHCNV